jgi:hypothetical protein
LIEQGFRLTTPVPEGFLAFLEQDQIAQLTHRGLAHQILDPLDDGAGEYVIAFDGDCDAMEGAAQLYRGDGYRLLEIPRATQKPTADCVPELRRVFRSPMRFASSPWTETATHPDVNPHIQAMVGAVNRDIVHAQMLDLQGLDTRHSESHGGDLASRYIRNTLRNLGYGDVNFHDYNDWNDNVVCTRKGTVHPNEYVVVGAHYDSISRDGDYAPGADDNATGTVAIMEAARVMAGYEFARSVMFIAFSGEEQGLVGSEAWASQAAAAGMNIVAMINLDMLCYMAPGDAEDLDIISDTFSQDLRNTAFNAIRTYVPELAVVDGFLTRGSSDHASFWRNGYRAVFFFEDSGSYSPYIHTSNDIVGLSANNFDFMLKNVKAVIATVATLARPLRTVPPR